MVNTINVPYAAIGEYTLSPEFLIDFATEVYDFELTNSDFNFCFAVLSGRRISADQISLYIEHRLKKF